MTLHEKVVLSAYTGILMCDMSEVHQYIEKLLGRPVWTHELASEALWSEIKEKAKPDPATSSMFAIASDAATGVTTLIAGIPLIFPMQSMLQPSPTALRRWSTTATSILWRGRIDILTFKEFTAWCNEQACDGWWGMVEAMVCIDLMAEIRKLSFWKREKFWRELYEKHVLDEIVEPINQKILIDQLAARIPHTDQATTHEKEHSTMTINEYQALALRTESRITTDPVPYIRVLEGLMGLNGEAGEAIDLMKKVLFQGHEFDREHMAKELGDIAWYLAVSADAIGYDLESILQMNVDKLRTRYPDGFSTEQSLHRSANDI